MVLQKKEKEKNIYVMQLKTIKNLSVIFFMQSFNALTCAHLCSAWSFWSNVGWVVAQTRPIVLLCWPSLSDIPSFHCSDKTVVFSKMC